MFPIEAKKKSKWHEYTTFAFHIASIGNVSNTERLRTQQIAFVTLA